MLGVVRAIQLTAQDETHDRPGARAVRLIVRRVRPTPSSQLDLFGTTYTYHAFITDRDGETLALERSTTGGTLLARPRRGWSSRPAMASRAWRLRRR